MNIQNIEQYLTIRNIVLVLLALTLVLVLLTALGVLPTSPHYPNPSPPPEP